MLGRTGSTPQPAQASSSVANPAPAIVSDQYPSQLHVNGAPSMNAPLPSSGEPLQQSNLQPSQQPNTLQPAPQRVGFFGRMLGRKPAAQAPVNAPVAEKVPQVTLPPLNHLSLFVRITQAWAIYLTLAPAIVSIILKETSFFSYVLLGCLGWSGALVTETLVVYFWLKKRIEPCYILDVALTLLFAGFVGASLGGDSSYKAGVVRYYNISLHGWLGLVMLGSYLLRYPWILQHAKEASPKYVWTSKSFLEVVNSLTIAWTISQFLTAALCVVPLFVGTNQLMDPVDLVLNYVFPILTIVVMLCMTRWFPNFARVRWLIPRHSSSVKPLPDAEMGFAPPLPPHDPRSMPEVQPQPQGGLQPQYGLGVDANDRPIARSLQPQFGIDSEEPSNVRQPFRVASEMSNSSLDDNFPHPVRAKEKAPLLVPQIGKHLADKRAPDGFGLVSETGSERKGLPALRKPQDPVVRSDLGYGLVKETAGGGGGGLKSSQGSKFGLDSDLDSDGSSMAAPNPPPRRSGFGLVAEENDRDKPRSPLVSNSRQPLPSIRKPVSKGGFGLDAE
jgi:hypothetical protein